MSYCTLVYSNDYVPGALVLGESLKNYDPDVNRIVLVTPQVDANTRIKLGKVWHQVRLVEPISAPFTKELDLLGREKLATACTKLRVWELDSYKRIVYLDADTLPLTSLSHLFEALPFGSRIAAAPDIGWPDIFNSGVFVTEPSRAIFEELLELVKSGASFDGSDQGLLNTYFQDWHRLSFTYNVTASASYQYAPAYERFKKDIKVFHFIGTQKPWNSPAHNDMAKLWQAIYNEKVDQHKAYEDIPKFNESKLILPSANRWDPTQFAPPVESKPEAETFDERAESEPPTFEFMSYGPSTHKFPWEQKNSTTRVFPKGYD